MPQGLCRFRRHYMGQYLQHELCILLLSSWKSTTWLALQGRGIFVEIRQATELRHPCRLQEAIASADCEPERERRKYGRFESIAWGVPDQSTILRAAPAGTLPDAPIPTSLPCPTLSRLAVV